MANNQIQYQIGRVLEAREWLSNLNKKNIHKNSSAYRRAADGVRREEAKLVDMVIFLLAPDEEKFS